MTQEAKDRVYLAVVAATDVVYALGFAAVFLHIKNAGVVMSRVENAVFLVLLALFAGSIPFRWKRSKRDMERRRKDAAVAAKWWNW